MCVDEEIRCFYDELFDTNQNYCIVVVELPQTPEHDLRSTRAACGRRMSLSLLVHVCS